MHSAAKQTIGATGLHVTQRQLLRTVADAGAIGRAELALRLQLSQASVSVLARDLLDRGLLCEDLFVGKPIRRGRPSASLSLNPAAAFFLGAFVRSEPSVMVLTDLAGGVLAQGVLPGCATPAAIGPAIRHALPALLATAGVARSRIGGIGLALTGLIDHEAGVCLQSSLLGWQDEPVAQLVTRDLGIPTWLENDANVVAMGERLFGAARGARDFSVIVLGDGIGCAHVMGGALYRGHGGGAGEIAHVTIEADGLPCRCGRRGCLDTVASRSAVVDAAVRGGCQVTTPHEVEMRALAGDASCVQVLHRAGRALGLAIAQLIQINSPRFVLVTDIGDNCGALFTTVVRQTVSTHVLPRLAAGVELRFVAGDADIWARGAASHAASQFLDGHGMFQEA